MGVILRKLFWLVKWRYRRLLW